MVEVQSLMPNWQHERSMTPEQFESALERLGMTPAAASRFLGQSQRQTYRMVHGESKVPVTFVLLLSSMIHHDEKPVVPRRAPREF